MYKTSAGIGEKFPPSSPYISSGLDVSLGSRFRNMSALRDKRHGRGSGNLLLQNRKSISRVFVYSVVRSYTFCIEQKNLPHSEHQVHKLCSLRIVELKAFLHWVTWYKLDKNQINNLHNNQIYRWRNGTAVRLRSTSRVTQLVSSKARLQTWIISLHSPHPQSPRCLTCW